MGSAWNTGVCGWRGSGSQEASIHRHSGARGHAAAVTQQEEDGVYHVLHLCGRGGVQDVVERSCPSSFPPTPHLSKPLIQLPAGLPPDSPANLPSGMRSSMVLAFWGSLQLAWPMGVITTVGLSAFTRICTGTGRGSAGWAEALWARGLGDGRHPSRAHLVWPKLQSHHLGQHVQGTLGGACEERQPVWSLSWLLRLGGWGGQGTAGACSQ